MRRLFVALSALTLLSACQQPQQEGVSDARVQLPAVAGRPGAAYFTLLGGAAENRLMQISSPQIVRVELHESLMKDGMMTMQAIEGGVTIPAGTKVAFAPGGKHAMLYDINPSVKPGDKVKLTFAYANGRTIEVDAVARAASDDEGHAH